MIESLKKRISDRQKYKLSMEPIKKEIKRLIDKLVNLLKELNKGK